MRAGRRRSRGPIEPVIYVLPPLVLLFALRRYVMASLGMISAAP
jgi:hypothetical protein